jgi:diguanylate cyclase (GGDEF)-like protein/PAS domain S-box-containing protein
MGIGRSTQGGDKETFHAGNGGRVQPWLALNALLVRFYEYFVIHDASGMRRYPLAFAFTLLALLLRMAIGPPGSGLQFVTFFPAVALSAVFLGTGPGLLTTLLCAVTASYFYFPPYQAFPLEMQPQMLLPVLVFCIDGVVVSLAIGAMHHYYARYRTSIAELQERELRYRGAVETSKDGFLLIGRNSRVIGTNEAYCRMSGYHRAELIALTIPELEARETAADVAEHFARIIEQGHDRFESLHRRKDGSIWPVEITVSISPPLGELFVFARDLTETKALEAERARSEETIRNLAFQDPLTQLPNRRLLSDRLRQELAKAQRSQRYGALLFIDMDNFKQLNDSLGHDMGDKLLVLVAQRLSDCVREGDTVARLGGDEFVVMLNALDVAVDVAARLTRQVGEKILESLNQPYPLDSHIYFSTPSIGATLFLDDREAVDAIFRRADNAMYRVKGAGRNALCFFDGDVLGPAPHPQ